MTIGYGGGGGCRQSMADLVYAAAFAAAYARSDVMNGYPAQGYTPPAWHAEQTRRSHAHAKMAAEAMERDVTEPCGRCEGRGETWGESHEYGDQRVICERCDGSGVADE